MNIFKDLRRRVHAFLHPLPAPIVPGISSVTLHVGQELEIVTLKANHAYVKDLESYVNKDLVKRELFDQIMDNIWGNFNEFVSFDKCSIDSQREVYQMKLRIVRIK